MYHIFDILNLKVKDALKQDKLEFNLELHKQYETFEAYLKQLDNIKESNRSFSPINFMAQDSSLTTYEDPIFLLSKLTELPETTKELITLGRFWQYVRRWENNDGDISLIISTYRYIENSLLRVGTFILLWKISLGTWMINNIKVNKDGIAEEILEKLLELTLLFKKDVLNVKKTIQEYIIMDQTKDRKMLLDKLLRNKFNIIFYKKYSNSAKITNKYDIVHNMLYHSSLIDIMEIITSEIGKFLDDNLNIEETNKNIAFKKYNVKIIIRILYVLKSIQVLAKEGKNNYKFEDMLNITNLNLDNIVTMKEEATLKLINEMENTDTNSLNNKLEFLGEHLTINFYTGKGLCKKVGINCDQVIKYIVRKLILTGNDKELKTNLPLIADNNCFDTDLTNFYKERIAKHLSKNEKQLEELKLTPYLNLKPNFGLIDDSLERIKISLYVLKGSSNVKVITEIEELLKEVSLHGIY